MSASRKTIHQFHYSAAPGDAVTNQMRFLRRTLAEQNIAGEIFAVDLKEGLDGEVRSFSPAALWSADVVLVHHSHGNPALKQILSAEVPKALVYHNVTPASFFSHDSRMRALSALGRKQLVQFKSSVIDVFADSWYNVAELNELGFGEARKLPLFDAETFRLPQKTKKKSKSLNLLFVGRVTPHKNQAFLVEVIYQLVNRFSLDARLQIVGGTDPVYARYLNWLAEDLGIPARIRIEGKVSDKALRTVFSQADAFVCASLHEGFCIPLVSAMAARLPIFALGSAAVPETLGGAGVLFEKTDPAEFAAAVAAAMADESKDELSELAIARFEEIAKEQSPEAVVSVLSETLKRAGTAPAPSRKRIYSE